MSINDYIGCPFEQGGRGPDTFDCWGVVFHAAWNVYGIAYPSYSEQYTTPLDYRELKSLISDELTINWQQIPHGNEQPGDVIILRLKNMPIHAGLVVQRGKMLHVYEGTDTVIEDYNRPHWKHKVYGFYRYS